MSMKKKVVEIMNNLLQTFFFLLVFLENFFGTNWIDWKMKEKVREEEDGGRERERVRVGERDRY